MAKVLVVDDSGLSRRVIVAAVKSAGHEVMQAADGEKGVKAFRAFGPDLVMSDLLMPVMDGFGLTAAIRSIDPDMPIIITTADIQDRSRERCEALGVTRMLTKPAKKEEIVAAVEEALAAREVTVACD